MEKDRKCKYCNKEFSNINGRIFSNHVKWCIDNPNSPRQHICDKCGVKISSNSISIHNCEDKKTKCVECNKLFYRNCDEKFCSRYCAAVSNNRKRKNEGYISPLKGMKCDLIEKKCTNCGNSFSIACNQHKIVKCDECRGILITSKKRYVLLPTNCVICGKETTYRSGQKVKKTCSRECYSKLMSNNAKQNINCGGETNYKRYVYNGISMDSTWEVEVAKLMDSLNIKWDRSKKLCLWWYDDKNNKRRYHPDFYLPNFDVFLDTKNKYLMEQDKYKIQKVLENNKVNLIVGSLEVVKNYILKLVNPT